MVDIYGSTVFIACVTLLFGLREIRFIQSKSTFIRMREIFASFVRKDLSARTTDSLNYVYEYNVHLKRQSREKKIFPF